MTDLPKLIPPSPNAAALGKYGDIPESANTHSTGLRTDQQTFWQYQTNIIVGPLGTVNRNSVTKKPDGTLSIPTRTNGAVIYDSNSIPRVELTRRAVEEIL